MQALLDPSNLESAVQLVTKLDDSIKEISLQVRDLTRMTGILKYFPFTARQFR